MASEKFGRSTLEVNSISSDYSFDNYIELWAIQFRPGASGDRLVVRDALQNDEPTIMDAYAVDQGTYILYFGGIEMIPSITFSECTLSSGHKVIFQALNNSIWRRK